MGLISKIEDKLSSNKGDSDHGQLQKSSYEDSSSSSHLRHPVSSGTTGSQGYGSSTTGTQGYGSSTTGTTGSSAMPGSHHTGGVGHDGHGSSTSGYGKVDSRDTAGGHGSSTRNDPRDATTAGGYGSSTRTDPRDHTSSGGVGSGPREQYDPYSSKGQTAAANAATGYSGGTSRGDNYGSSTYANEPNVPRSHDGGILKPGSHPAAHNPDAIPTAGGQKVGGSGINDPYSSNTSSSRNDPYSTSTHNPRGHPIRDAAMAGGAGAGGGYGASRLHDDRSTHDSSLTGHHTSSNHPQDVSYENRSGGAGGMEPGMGSTTHSSGLTGSGSGMGSTIQSGGMTGSNTMGGSNAPQTDPKKMGGAYEAGYRDALEHAEKEMGLNK